MQTLPSSAGPGSVGKPIDRVEGRLKATGGVRYAAEAPVQGVAHATIVSSTIASGRITKIDDAAAKASPGVLAVVTHLNKPDVATPKPDFAGGGITAEQRMPLADDKVLHLGQHVAIVVARTLEQSRHAAALLKIDYEQKPGVYELDAPEAKANPNPNFMGERMSGKVGDPDAALAATGDGVVKHEATYVTPHQAHAPMEPSATVAAFEGDRLTLYDATQWIVGTRAVVADMMRMPRENVRVICPYVGGAFGCKGFIWPHTLLTVMAAKVAGVPVKMALTRSQMFQTTGHRPETHQAISLAANKADGKLTAIKHVCRVPASRVGQFVEPCAMGTTRVAYAAPNIAWSHASVPLDLPEGTFMRAPGETPGTFALESAMDELAYKLDLDPLELRLRNFAREKNPTDGKPWSSNFLGDCYTQSAAKFGWSKRDPTPKSMTYGDLMVGYGMATAMFPGYRMGGVCRLRLTADGRATLSISAHDIGQGAYTALAQITADALGVDAANVKVELGDSTLPPGPLAGGSNTTATVSVAIHDAMTNLAKQLGKEGEKGVALVDAVRATGRPHADAQGKSQPGPEMQKWGFQSFGAHFVEVAIDPLMPRVQVRRVVSMFDVGRIVNPKTARSQGIGGIIMGLGMALTEGIRYDHRNGRTVNDNLADYAVPVHADIGEIDVSFTDKPDPHFNPVGVRGVGEIGITGVAAAVANAVYHATGVRVRELPILPHKVLG